MVVIPILGDNEMRIFLKIVRTLALCLAIILVLSAAVFFYLDYSGIIRVEGKDLNRTAKYFWIRYSPLKSEMLSRREAMEDAAELFAAFERIHPDIAANVGKEAYQKLKLRTYGEIREKTEKYGRVSVKDLAYILYYSATAIGDGHSRVYWTYYPKPGEGSLFPPFTLKFDRGKFIVVSSVDKELKGLEITAVNGIPFREFVRPIIDRCAGEMFSFKMQHFTDQQAFWWDFSGLFADLESFELSARGAKAERIISRQKAVSYREFILLKSPEWRNPGTRLAIYDNGKTGWLTYGKFDSSEEKKKELGGVFRELHEKRVEDLVIDIRGNGGGTTPVGEFILSYLIDRPFTQSSGSIIKFSPDYIKLGEFGPGADKNKDLAVFFSKQEEQHDRPEAFFKGKVRLLIDGKVYSSAVAFASAFRDYAVGEIIGYESGGTPTSFGSAIPMEFSHSRGLGYSVSAKKIFNPKPRPGDDRRGVVPDVALTAELLRPYKGDIKAFVLTRIARERAKR